MTSGKFEDGTPWPKLPGKPYADRIGKPRRNETRELTHPVQALINSMPGCRCWRNNVGFANAASDGAPIRYGLAVGSADLIGIVDGKFAAFEVKWPGKKPGKDQLRWLAEVRKLGGFATVIHSEAEARAAIVRCRMGMNE